MSFLDSTDNRLTCYIKLQKDAVNKSNTGTHTHTHTCHLTHTYTTAVSLPRERDSAGVTVKTEETYV